MSAAGGKFAALAAMLNEEPVFETVADAIATARDAGPRLRDKNGAPIDRDSGDVLEDVIKTLRASDA